jgi:hypothetical protein
MSNQNNNLLDEDQIVSIRDQTNSNSPRREEDDVLDDTLFIGEGDQVLSNEDSVLIYKQNIDSLKFTIAMANKNLKKIDENEMRRILALPPVEREAMLALKNTTFLAASEASMRQMNSSLNSNVMVGGGGKSNPIVISPETFKMLESMTKAAQSAWERMQCKIDNLHDADNSGVPRDRISLTLSLNIRDALIMMITLPSSEPSLRKSSRR